MKKLIPALLIIAAILAGLGLFYKRDLERAAFAASLFTGVEQYETFAKLSELYPISAMQASSKPYHFDNGPGVSLPESFHGFDSVKRDTQAFLEETDTGGLLVLHQGKIVYENYWLSGGENTQWLSMSVAKSFIATGIGIAVDEGLIDINKAISHYVPSLKGSAYDEVRIEDVLQMSSGAAWNEDYSNPDSDVLRLGKIMAIGGSLDEFVATLKRENEPGTKNHYNSADTQALGMLLARATGQSVTQYLQHKLWQPLGMENDGNWLVDDYQVEMAFAGLNATARDYAKLGELYRLKGLWQGKQIVSASWVDKSTRVLAPHLAPNLDPIFPLGYGYQWWIPESTESEYSAVGVYNQFIFVNPSRDLVIVKLSANSEYGTTEGEESNKELTTIEMFRAIAQSFPVSAF